MEISWDKLGLEESFSLAFPGELNRFQLEQY
jgi:hypothetical protein